jgi:hypothetical protein
VYWTETYGGQLLSGAKLAKSCSVYQEETGLRMTWILCCVNTHCGVLMSCCCHRFASVIWERFTYNLESCELHENYTIKYKDVCCIVWSDVPRRHFF